MINVISTVSDLDLDLVARVAWNGEPCELGEQALDALRLRRAEFENFVAANQDRRLYGITTKHHLGAKTLLESDARAEFSLRLPSTPATVGEPLPERLVRTIVLTRLSDVLNGTACLRPETAVRLVRMLDSKMPTVPTRGHGEPGDIIALGHLFRARFDGTLQLGEGMALINGSPVAAAALTDAALAGRRRVTVVERSLALAAVAAEAPADHFAPELGALWKDEHQEAALLSVHRLIERDRSSRYTSYQAPVSFRSGPRVAGWVRRAQAAAEECVRIALQASSNNPVFVGPDVFPPDGAVLSNGGYHNPMIAATLDSLARAWADASQLVASQVNRLVEDPAGLAATEPEAQVSLLYMTSAGWAEEARAAAGSASLIGLGCGGQTDTGTPDLLAWKKATTAGEALDVNLSVLSIVAAHTIASKGLDVPPNLSGFCAEVLTAFPVGTAPVDFAGRTSDVIKVLDQDAWQ
ncbi:aromatic amino acid lyase [Streptomyces europaeiscabiei]|uniref:aromatic amino acid lyase n=1 Tax=Streptomyces europaeiscabiei TaxID=146819 RepID=UPI0029AE1F9D|nr:aromatic amino acid lyase [Streptomyces europaeiscabiei]MDX3612183.1 aromatic amino acid lyase [Streptomyces europaeiscabiei]MDX3630416.1 aromatic amino acid lyase [Streptomyces europaeiscabiei]MDX3648553.1 aromatic amino acid lyase [Streptomyces europaeiscabiei]WUD30931.1 aromatic amino acid lyase [Streptomyces europaeiscabiei]